MDFNRVLKFVVVLGLAVAVWKVGLPWAKRQNFGGTHATSSGARGESPCLAGVEAASSAWSDGIGRFVNPPYDLNAWSSFRSDVDAKIGTATSRCGGAEESAQRARTAMSDLQAVIGELDSAIRSGGAPPEDLVQRQDRIDSLINEAAELARAGK